MSDEQMLGTEEDGERIAKRGFGLSDEEVAAASDPESDISKELEEAHKAYEKENK
jgi:hypothetical protein